MDAQKLHSDKLSLINWITRLQDANILNELIRIQSKNEENSDFAVPDWHQAEVRKRIEMGNSVDYMSLDDLDDLLSLD